MIDKSFKIYATETQAKYIDAVIEHGSGGKAAKALGIHKSSLNKSLAAVMRKATAQGWNPEHQLIHKVPDPFILGAYTQQFGPDGTQERIWLKTKLDDKRRMELIQEGIEAFMEDVPKVVVPVAPLDYQSDIIPWIQIGDAHIGMLAHASETGEAFDLVIAERELCAAIAMLLDELPNCERIVINDLGDATHYDNMTATTAASGHPLDADGRHSKMVRVYSRVMRFIVDKALSKAKHVDVIINQGNHSRINDFWMRELLTVAYGHTDRVHVLDNDSVFVGYRMGNTFVMTHHSDKCPPARLIGVLTSDFRRDFGETEFHYIDIGHVHHRFVCKEHPSVIIESWNHLAATDKWAHEAGYRSRKSISIALRSRTYGDVGRRVLPVEEVRARVNTAMGMATQAKRLAYSV